MNPIVNSVNQYQNLAAIKCNNNEGLRIVVWGN